MSFKIWFPWFGRSSSPKDVHPDIDELRQKTDDHERRIVDLEREYEIREFIRSQRTDKAHD